MIRLMVILTLVALIGLLVLIQHPSDTDRLLTFKAQCLASDAYTTQTCRDSFIIECQRMLGYGRLQCLGLWQS